jgi:hypothetical protein
MSSYWWMFECSGQPLYPLLQLYHSCNNDCNKGNDMTTKLHWSRYRTSSSWKVVNSSSRHLVISSSRSLVLSSSRSLVLSFSRPLVGLSSSRQLVILSSRRLVISSSRVSCLVSHVSCLCISSLVSCILNLVDIIRKLDQRASGGLTFVLSSSRLLSLVSCFLVSSLANGYWVSCILDIWDGFWLSWKSGKVMENQDNQAITKGIGNLVFLGYPSRQAIRKGWRKSR